MEARFESGARQLGKLSWLEFAEVLMVKGDKFPWMKFFPSDWLSDVNLKMCSLEARGVWIDMLCMMWECEERGRLSTCGRALSPEEVAAAISGDFRKVLACIHELVAKGVCARSKDGVLYNRRMVREFETSQARKTAGSKGGRAAKQNMQQKGQQKHQQNGQQNSSKTLTSDICLLDSSSSEASASETRAPPARDSPTAEDIYQAYPRKAGKKSALRAIERALADVKRDDAAEWLLERVRAFAASPAGKAGEFTPHPATWFNAGRYDDDDAEWNRQRTDDNPGRHREADSSAYRRVDGTFGF